MVLVEVAPSDRPPVCRIMDHGKWKYQQKKKHKGRHSHDVQIKEVRIRPKTDPHDKSIKMSRAIKFLKEGDKVQFTMIFRGRERFHAERGLAILRSIAVELEEMAKVERSPSRMDGNKRMTMLLSPLKAPAPPKQPKAARPKPPPAGPKPPPAGPQPAPTGPQPAPATAPQAASPPPPAPPAAALSAEPSAPPPQGSAVRAEG